MMAMKGGGKVGKPMTSEGTGKRVTVKKAAGAKVRTPRAGKGKARSAVMGQPPPTLGAQQRTGMGKIVKAGKKGM